MALPHVSVAQTDWKERASDELIGRTDTVIISWPEDHLSLSMGKTGDGFNRDTFARDVVCKTIRQAGKPANTHVLISLYQLDYDGTEMHEELLATESCD